MVLLQLSIKAELENVTGLRPAQDFNFHFKVECTNCRDIHPTFVTMNRIDEYEKSGGKNSKAHFVWKCHGCNQEHSARFQTPDVPYCNQNAQFAPLLVLDCRGLEFIEFDPMGLWSCVGIETKTPFEVDLTEDVWVDYDEKARSSVGVSDFESCWDKVRNA